MASENHILKKQCGGLKNLMVNYEREALYHRIESDVS